MSVESSVHLDFAAAQHAVSQVALRTPLLEVPALGERLGRPVLVKAECLQVTGSFKVRGAAARLAALTEEEQERGVVACSSGNHGRAVAYVAERFGVPATVCVPQWVDPVKLEAIRRSGAEAVLAGDTFDEAERHAIDLARRGGNVYVSAYDDPWVIAGQGTVALEILEELRGVAPAASERPLDGPARAGSVAAGAADAADAGARVPAALLVPLSGGGLVGGIAAAMRERLGGPAREEAAAGEGPSPDGLPRVVAVSAERAAVMLASVRAGRPVEVPEEETLASALAGGLGPANRYSFPLVRALVDEHVTVTEEHIAQAMRYAVRSLRLVVEGGGAVGLAALLAGAWSPGRLAGSEAPANGPVVVVLSGGNVAPSLLADILRSR